MKNNLIKETLKNFHLYLDYIEAHYDSIQEAWKLMKQKCPHEVLCNKDESLFELIEKEVEYHDFSKFSEGEFTQYRQYFFPNSNKDPNEFIFDAGFRHHIAHNNHHPENWRFKEKDHPYLYAFVVMNVIDLVAMGLDKGKKNAKDYYKENKEKLAFPKWADKLANQLFKYIYKK